MAFSVHGNPLVGQTLSVVAPPGVTINSVQWLRNNIPIAGATGLSYTLVTADLGQYVRPSVTAVTVADQRLVGAGQPILYLNGQPVLVDGSPIEFNRAPVSAGVIALGDQDVGTGYLLAAATILAGVSDPENDTLTIVGHSVTTGNATISGTGPYTLTITGEGVGMASFTISDGRGETVTRSVSWNGLPVFVNQPPYIPGVLVLESFDETAELTITEAQLLVGVTDPDGGTPTVTNLAVATGAAELSGSGPWVLMGPVGTGSLIATIQDGQGGSTSRTINYSITSAAAGPGLFTFEMVPTSAGELDSASRYGTDVSDLTVVSTGEHGTTMTVTSVSNGFAAGGLPQYLVYDDHAYATPGDLVGLTATIGAWSVLDTNEGGSAPVYMAGGVGGRPFVRDYDGPNNRRLARRVDFPTPVTEVFCARALRVPSVWPGSTDNGAVWDYEEQYIPRDSTLKTDWARYHPSGGDPNSDLILGSHSSASIFSVTGNSVPGSVSLDLMPLVAFNSWFELRSWAKDNASNHNASNVHLRVSGVRGSQTVKTAAGQVLSAGGIGYAPFNHLTSGAWVDTNPYTVVDRGYSYIAAGTNAPCRVEIGNRPIFEECEILSAMPPNAWAPGSVSARHNAGLLNNDEPQFVFVILANNEPQSSIGKFLNPEVLLG